jgi:hypothetical protein
MLLMLVSSNRGNAAVFSEVGPAVWVNVLELLATALGLAPSSQLPAKFLGKEYAFMLPKLSDLGSPEHSFSTCGQSPHGAKAENTLSVPRPASVSELVVVSKLCMVEAVAGWSERQTPVVQIIVRMVEVWT